jgi:extradiol dioxygenase family protein
MSLSPFHLAIQVRDIGEAREFYGGLIGCAEGRSSAHWVDFNLYGHQLVCHLDPGLGKHGRIDSHYNPVDGDQVPVPHFGIVLPLNAWQELAARLTASGTAFVVQPHVRFMGEAGEQATFFFLDPSGNALEFKAFKDLARLFAR